jgi:hypothetical protein
MLGACGLLARNVWASHFRRPGSPPGPAYCIAVVFFSVRPKLAPIISTKSVHTHIPALPLLTAHSPFATGGKLWPILNLVPLVVLI